MDPIRSCRRCEVTWRGEPTDCWVCGRPGEAAPMPVVDASNESPLDPEEFAELWERAIPFV